MQRIFAFAFIVVVFIAGVVMLELFPVTTVTSDGFVGSALRVSFSETDHFFDEDFAIVITASLPFAEIFYTTDGSIPTINSQRYTGPLFFEVGENVETVVLRAIAVAGYETSATNTHTFFYGAGVHSRFDTLVFSLSTDQRNLHDFYTGIFTEGIVRQEYLAENPGANVTALTPANFNQRGREWERPVYIEMFYPNGERAFMQAAGMRVTGGYARGEDIRSLRLIARREYSPQSGSFRYRFFPGDVSHDERGRAISEYDNIILRNGGQDRQHGILRHELGSVLARRAGFIDVTPVRAAALFVNGEYHGHMWLQTRVDDNYLQRLYNAPRRDFDVLGRGEWVFRDITPEEEQALTYKNLFAWRDLTDDDEFAQLEAILDVDNMLRYYAFQIWVGNNDWPHDNLYRWRYTGELSPGLPQELDGRWRFAMFSMDQTFGHIGGDYRRATLQPLMELEVFDGLLLRNVLTRPEMVERFIEILHELMEYTLNYETIREVLEELYGDISNELGFALEAGLLNEGVTRETIAQYHEDTLHFAANRHLYILESLEYFFG
ncbi:MAG: CotH kinase family protein [Defluviitaleaceae bacterium]|nr:CotH kinase family protein [Defluviitaleaceae bacterium]MCL2263016.1 CotH kinase family protein [Defluviitaleaceae bacterium]